MSMIPSVALLWAAAAAPFLPSPYPPSPILLVQNGSSFLLNASHCGDPTIAFNLSLEALQPIANLTIQIDSCQNVLLRVLSASSLTDVRIQIRNSSLNYTRGNELPVTIVNQIIGWPSHPEVRRFPYTTLLMAETITNVMLQVQDQSRMESCSSAISVRSVVEHSAFVWDRAVVTSLQPLLWIFRDDNLPVTRVHNVTLQVRQSTLRFPRLLIGDAAMMTSQQCVLQIYGALELSQIDLLFDGSNITCQQTISSPQVLVSPPGGFYLHGISFLLHYAPENNLIGVADHVRVQSLATTWDVQALVVPQLVWIVGESKSLGQDSQADWLFFQANPLPGTNGYVGFTIRDLEVTVLGGRMRVAGTSEVSVVSYSNVNLYDSILRIALLESLIVESIGALKNTTKSRYAAIISTSPVTTLRRNTTFVVEHMHNVQLRVVSGLILTPTAPWYDPSRSDTEGNPLKSGWSASSISAQVAVVSLIDGEPIPNALRRTIHAEVENSMTTAVVVVGPTESRGIR